MYWHSIYPFFEEGGFEASYWCYRHEKEYTDLLTGFWMGDEGAECCVCSVKEVSISWFSSATKWHPQLSYKFKASKTNFFSTKRHLYWPCVLSKEETRRLCQNYVKPLRLLQCKLLDYSQIILFSLIKLFFRVQASVYWQPIVITEPTVASAWPLSLGSKHGS